MQDDTHARTSVTEVTLPASLTTPLPEDATPLDVAARTAATTALGVDGVHHLGGVLDRAADQLRARLGRSASAPGVRVDDTEGTLDVRVSLVVTYPERVAAVADEVRAQVGHALGQLAALPVRVDVRVTDVHDPFDDAPADGDGTAATAAEVAPPATGSDP